MKWITILLLFFVQVFNLYGQKKPYTEQEFEIRNVSIIPHSDKFNPDVQLDLILATKYSLRDIETEGNSMFATYQLKFWVGGDNPEDSLTGIVYDRNYTMMSDAEGFFANSTNITLTIPYYQFRKTGLQNCRVYCLAGTESGEFNYPVASSGNLKVNISKTYPLSEQVITLSNLKISQPVILTEGITFEFNYKFKYNENELHPDAGDNVNYNNRVYFYANLYDDVNDLISLNTNILLNSDVVPQVKGISGKYRFIVPTTDMNLEAGKKTVQYSICASTSDGNFKKKDLSNGNTILNIPHKYLTKIKLSNIGLHETQYDVAGQNIPLINIFMNNRKTSGKGYPDIYWSLSTRNRIIETSGVYKNSFYFKDDSLLLQTFKEDKLTYEVYDDDFFGRDDLIGKFNISMGGINKKEYKKLNFGGIKSGEITLDRRPFEKYFLDDLSLNPMKDGTYILKGRCSESQSTALKGILINGAESFDLQEIIAKDMNPEKDHFEFLIPGSIINGAFKIQLVLFDAGIKADLVEKTVYSGDKIY